MMSQPSDEPLLWDVRSFVYATFTATERPPTVAEIAAYFQIGTGDAQRLLGELHDRHALFLDPQTKAIRIANPYSAVPTRYRVAASGRFYWANCAWDALGIPAMLGSDATIHTRYADTDELVMIAVRSGQLSSPPPGVVHFPLPFVQWYDDLVFT